MEYTEGKRHCRTLKKKPIKFSKTFKTRNAFFNLPNIYGVFKNPKKNFRVPNPSLYLKCLRRSLDLSRFFFATGLTNAIFFSSLKNFFNEIFWDCQIEIWDYSRQRNEKWYLWNEIRICCVCSELLCKKKAISQAVKKLCICHKNLLMLSIYQHNISLFK